MSQKLNIDKKTKNTFIVNGYSDGASNETRRQVEATLHVYRNGGQIRVYYADEASRESILSLNDSCYPLIQNYLEEDMLHHRRM